MHQPCLRGVQVMRALLSAAERSNPAAWRTFQQQMQTLKLTRQRLQGEQSDLAALIDQAERDAGKQQGLGMPLIPGASMQGVGFRM